MLLDIANLEQDVNRYVFLIMDEVHIKQDLVFDKHFKTLLGFVNIGEDLCQAKVVNQFWQNPCWY